MPGAVGAATHGARRPGADERCDEAVDPPDDPEAVRDAKGWLSARMPPGRRYRETLHQASFSNMFDLDLARAAPSFDKLWRDVGSLIGAAG